jgi:cytochrome c oxidase accessory protein FixG
MSIVHAPEQVLSTLNEDGTRHKINPKVSHGRFFSARRLVGYALIALFVLLPRVEIGGKPAILLDLVRREFTFFGATFRPADGFILMLFGLAVVLTAFFVTALAGRVWCGWGCPQTVYMEWVFRPLERLLKKRRPLMWMAYAVLAVALSNVFLAYFVTADTVETWAFGSPAAHPVGFAVVAGVSALIFFDFAYFREQMCVLACPYGRLQSVLLDKHSLIIGYDEKRGEPRGKAGNRKKALPVLRDGGAPLGDCVDCKACVATCPTGIDIRRGLQMECIGCAQCIDACDAIMTKLERPRGLIRYTSKIELAGQPRRLLRPRVLIYPALLALVGVLFLVQVGERTKADVWVLRQEGAPFTLLDDGTVSTPVRVKIENRAGVRHVYRVALEDQAGTRVIAARPEYPLEPGKSTIVPLFVISPRAAFRAGERDARVVISDDAGWKTSLAVTILGPETSP